MGGMWLKGQCTICHHGLHGSSSGEGHRAPPREGVFEKVTGATLVHLQFYRGDSQSMVGLGDKPGCQQGLLRAVEISWLLMPQSIVLPTRASAPLQLLD